MAGAEELRAFSPRIQDNMYLPDERMTQDILASGIRRNREDIQRLGNAKREDAQHMFDPVVSGLNAYDRSKRLGMESEESAQRLKGNELQYQRNAAAKSEEDAQREFMNQTGDNGQTRRDQLNQAQFQGELEKPGMTRDEHQAHMAQITHEIKLADAQLGQLGLAAANAKEARERDDLQSSFAGIYGDKSLTPEQQEAKAGALAQAHSGGKIPPQVVQGYMVAGRNGAAAAAQQGAITKQVLEQGTDTYQHMAHATGSAQQDAQTVQHLAELKNQYDNNLRFGFTGGALGKAGGENTVAQQARDEFAQSLDAMGKHELAAHVRDSGPTNVGERMGDVIGSLSAQTKDAWAREKAAIHPAMQGRPEVAQADQAIASLSSAGAPGTHKNNVSLAPGLGATTGSTANAMYLKGGNQAPAQDGMQPAAMPAQQPMITPPGYNPKVPPAQNGQAQAGRLPAPGGAIIPAGFQPGAMPAQQPGGYPYDFSKYKVNQQMPANGMGMGQ